MALVLMTDTELRALGINGQNTGFLDKQTGVFSQDGWSFVKDFIDSSQSNFIQVYTDGTNEVLVTQTKTSDTVAGLTGESFNEYEFYKDA